MGLRLSSSGRDRPRVDEENPYWISFSDIMAGLLIIFILAAVALILELTQKNEQFDEAIREIAKAEQVRREILAEVKAELNKRNIRVELSDNDTVLRIPDDVLSFERSKFNISQDENLRRVALEIGRVLYQSITKEDRWTYLDTVFVEGHTDKMPYRNASIKGNWGLSTFRAISVWDYWNNAMNEGRRLEDLVNHDNKKLFSVSGYAETRPNIDTLSDPDSEESLRKNRRIDIRFTVRRPALEDFEAVKSAMGR